MRKINKKSEKEKSSEKNNMRVGIRLAYPTKNQFDWSEALQAILPINEIELAFYLPEDFYKVEPEKVYLPIIKQKTEVNSIHLPHVDFTKPHLINDTLSKIILIAKNVNCNLLVAHPSFGRRGDFENLSLPIIDNFLNKENVDFCWETFSSQRRIFSNLEILSDFCQKHSRYYICYDSSHIGESQKKILADFGRYLSFIKIIHISNISSLKQHLPLWFDEGLLNFDEILEFLKKEEYSGTLILEYLLEFHNQLISDAAKIKKILMRKP